MWKLIPGYPNYAIKDDGKIMRLISRKCAKAGTILKDCVDPAGYRTLTLVNEQGVKTHRIHRLVASTFLGKRPLGYEVNHKDGDKLNCQISNLEYVTRKQNATHARILGLYAEGEQNPACTISDKQVVEMRELRRKGETLTVIALRFKCAVSHAHRIVTNQSRKETCYG